MLTLFWQHQNDYVHTNLRRKLCNKFKCSFYSILFQTCQHQNHKKTLNANHLRYAFTYILHSVLTLMRYMSTSFTCVWSYTLHVCNTVAGFRSIFLEWLLVGYTLITLIAFVLYTWCDFFAPALLHTGISSTIPNRVYSQRWPVCNRFVPFPR